MIHPDFVTQYCQYYVLLNFSPNLAVTSVPIGLVVLGSDAFEIECFRYEIAPGLVSH